MSNGNALAGSLTQRISKILPRVTYRKAESDEHRNSIFRLRHDAYVREAAIVPHPSGLFSDEVDDADNTHLFGVYIDETLMSSIRFSVSSSLMHDLPTAHVFPDFLEPQMAAGTVIVDPTRFVVDYASSRLHQELPYITLRLTWMALEYFEADILLAAVRPEHAAFYRRFFCTQMVAPARDYPLLTKPVCLTLSRYAEVRDTVQGRYPFLASTAGERERVFNGATPRTETAGAIHGHDARNC